MFNLCIDIQGKHNLILMHFMLQHIVKIRKTVINFKYKILSSIRFQGKGKVSKTYEYIKR